MTSHPTIVLGITGGIACGKSEVGRILASAGLHVLDADSLAHQLMKKGGPVWSDIVACFGSRILSPEEDVDRGKLGALVFNHPARLEELNRLVHPAVRASIAEWVDARQKAKEDAAVLIPLLFEAGFTEGWDAVICVTAEDSQVFQRLEKRGLTRAEAEQRIAAQMPLAQKADQSDLIIENNGSLAALHRETLHVLTSLRTKRKKYE